MSLYDYALGDGHQQERGQRLLPLLGSPAFPRYRDCWVETSAFAGLVIAVYTRQGGGNRECFCENHYAQHHPGTCYAAANEAAAAHPLYLRDADDEFDATYATFWFRVPDEHRGALAGTAVAPVDMGARWRQAIAAVERGELSPGMLALGDQIGAFLSDPVPASHVLEI